MREIEAGKCLYENIYIDIWYIFTMPCGRKRKLQKMRKHKLKKRRRKMRNKK